MRTMLKAAERGLVAGTIATLAMTAVIVAGRLVGLLSTIPPREITRRAEIATGIRRDISSDEFQLSWILAHLGYGTAAGAGLAAIRGRLPRSPIVAGLLYGVALWAFGYLGIMPALGLYPWPEDDSRTRLATMIVAHGVYGITAAEVIRVMTREEHPSTNQGSVTPARST
ncbi:MAG: DUF6789 family protein [Candidatus Dormibacteraceae bacterium]